MPKLNVAGFGSFDVPEGKRLVLALEEDVGIDVLHACGGNARCTTCRVEFAEGEPQKSTQAEKQTLKARGIEGARLSCQILCEGDMTLSVVNRLEGSGRKDAGSKPTHQISPEPEWT